MSSAGDEDDAVQNATELAEKSRKREVDKSFKGEKRPEEEKGEEDMIKQLKKKLKKAEEAKEKAEERAKKAEEEKKRETEAKEKAEEEKKREKEANDKLQGKYFSTFTTVWEAHPQPFKELHFEAMRREMGSIPCFRSRDNKNPDLYAVNMQGAYNTNYRVKNDAQSARTSHKSKSNKDEIWPCDIFGHDLKAIDEQSKGDKEATGAAAATLDYVQSLVDNHGVDTSFKAPDYALPHADTEDDDQVQRDGNDGEQEHTIHGELAHLVPASPRHASLYFNVAKWVFGLSDVVSPEIVQKLIHGFCSNTRTKRERHSGLKHMCCNKIRLRCQRQHFDAAPCVLIVPILSEQKMKTWSGEGYDAVVMIDDKEKKLEAVATGTRFGSSQETEEATAGEIETARCLLATAVRALAYSLVEKSPDNLSFFTDVHRDLLKNYRKAFAAQDGSKKVKIPVQSKKLIHGQCKVRKIKFFGPSERGHPAPDPILLVVKGAITWSAFHEERLLAGGEPNDDDLVSESSLQEEELFLQWREESRRRHNRKTFAIESISFRTPQEHVV